MFKKKKKPELNPRRKKIQRRIKMGLAAIILATPEVAPRILARDEQQTHPVVAHYAWYQDVHCKSGAYYSLLPGVNWRFCARTPRLQTSNRWGFHDGPFQFDKDPGVRRIMVLGDSMTAGAYTPLYKNNWPNVLESILNEAPLVEGERYEVYNWGTSAYNAKQMLALFEQVILPNFEFDAVILPTFHNDADVNDIHKWKKDGSGTFPISEIKYGDSNHPTYYDPHHWDFDDPRCRESLHFWVSRNSYAHALGKIFWDYARYHGVMPLVESLDLESKPYSEDPEENNPDRTLQDKVNEWTPSFWPFSPQFFSPTVNIDHRPTDVQMVIDQFADLSEDHGFTFGVFNIPDLKETEVGPYHLLDKYLIEMSKQRSNIPFYFVPPNTQIVPPLGIDEEGKPALLIYADRLQDKWPKAPAWDFHPSVVGHQHLARWVEPLARELLTHEPGDVIPSRYHPRGVNSGN